jgi:signal peptidase II
MLGRALAIAAAVVGLDQAAKWALLRHFHETGCAVHQQQVTAFLDLVLTCNRGVSFGLFNGSGASSLIFALGAAAIIAVLLFWLVRVRTSFLAVAIGLIVGGAIGNVIDRMRLGGVIDFIYFHAGSWYWPAFNFADSAICLGVAAMLFDGLLLRRAPPANRGEDVRHDRV